VETAESEDEFSNMEKAIGLVQRGAIAIVGPKNLLDFEATQRLCEVLDVPQVAIQVSGLSSFVNPCYNEYVLRMTPADLPQLIGIVAFIKHFGWKRVAVIASSDKSAREGIQDFVNDLKENDITLTTAEYFRVPSMEGPDEDIHPAYLESILNRVKRSGARVIVLKCDTEQVTRVLEQAWKLGLTENHAWVLTDSAVSEKHILPNGSFPAYMRGLIGFRQSVGSGFHNERVRLLWKQLGNTEGITVCARSSSLPLSLSQSLMLYHVFQILSLRIQC